MCFSEKEREGGRWKVNTTTDREVDFNGFFFKEEWERMEDRDSRGGGIEFKRKTDRLRILGIIVH